MMEDKVSSVMEKDEFKAAFKYFKSKVPCPDFSSVLDFSKDGEKMKNNFRCINVYPLDSKLDYHRKGLKLRPPCEWRVFSIVQHPGLIVVQNVFTFLGALTWIERCLHSFSEDPYRTNLSQQGLCLKENAWWSQVKEALVRGQNLKLIKQLRWATLGYHHNWNTKEYNEREKSPVPEDLEHLCRIILHGIGLPHCDTFKAEAAIVNYYPPGSTLSPHTDHSEPFKEAPLISLSFGQSGIFLIGGTNKSVPPTPMYLHHGDVMIMTGESRHCYHAIPRILDSKDIIHGHDGLIRFSLLMGRVIEICKKFVTNKSFTIHSHFVDLNSISLSENNIVGSSDNLEKYITINNQTSKTNELDETHALTSNEFDWNNFNLIHTNVLEAIYNYLNMFRINLNVRQVNSSER